MFLRKYQRTKDGKRHTYFALVESLRTERGPRQRIVAHLGELTADQQRRWQRTAVFHGRHEEGRELPLFLDATAAPPNTTAAPSNATAAPPNATAAPSNATDAPPNATDAPPNTTAAPPSPDPDIVRIRLGKVGWTNARAFGDVWLGWQLWRKLDLDKIVARHIKTGRETVPPATMVAIEVISRLCIG